MKNALNWFEIPVKDLGRAAAFYDAVFACTLKQEHFDGRPIAVFPADERGVAGALVQDASWSPSAQGTLVYLDASGALESCLARVKAAGGEVLLPRTSVGEPGFIAIVRDPEGNRVGLHSPA